MDRKHILFNTGKNDSQVSNNLTNNKVRFIFIGMDNCVQSVHSLARILTDYVGILGEDLMSSQQVLLGNIEAVTACFVSIIDKEDTTKGDLRFLNNPGTEDLLAVNENEKYIMTALTGMTDEGSDPQLTILPKLFPLEIGESVPIRHHLKDLLPKCTTYPTGFEGWVKSLH